MIFVIYIYTFVCVSVCVIVCVCVVWLCVCVLLNTASVAHMCMCIGPSTGPWGTYQWSQPQKKTKTKTNKNAYYSLLSCLPHFYNSQIVWERTHQGRLPSICPVQCTKKPITFLPRTFLGPTLGQVAISWKQLRWGPPSAPGSWPLSHPSHIFLFLPFFLLVS